MNKTKSVTEQDITKILGDWREGDRDALTRLIPLVYGELRRLASRHLARERPNHTLQTTGLVNEAYLRLCGQKRSPWKNRGQFMRIAAQLMRRILVDYAREMKTRKRGAEFKKIQLDTDLGAPSGRSLELELLEDALKDLERLDKTQCRIVEMRFFAGLTLEEIAKALDLETPRVKREWTMAKAWLFQYVNGIEP